MLKKIKMPVEPTEGEYGSDSPIVVCEACGKQGPSHLMINLMICTGSPGHPALSPFQCAAVEHWACSRICWGKVAHACIDEHMIPLLAHAHDKIGRVEERDHP